jgi:hypothetical protein
LRYILRQTALTLLSFFFLYLLVAGASFIVFPNPPSNGPRDFQAADNTIYMTVPKYVFLGRGVLDSSDPKVILVGASNTGVGFRQNLIQSRLSCAKVSNLGMGGANISEVGQVIDLVHEVQSDDDRRSNTFVIGIWFGMFVDSELKYADADRNRGETDIDIERYRYGFYRRTPNGPAAVLPPKWLDAGVTFLRPFLLIEKLARQARTGINWLVTGRGSAQRTDAEREIAVMSEEEKHKALDYWEESMGHKSGISAAQVELLKQTIDKLLLSGEKVVIVDLPIPAWHRDASPYESSYREALKDLLQQFGNRPNFTALSMDDLDGNLDYSDEVHAKRHLAEVWSIRLANVLDSFLCQDKPEKQRQVTLQSLTPASAGSKN